MIDIEDDVNRNGITVSNTVTIPAEFRGYDAFVGFRADIQGNCHYVPELRDDGAISTELARALNSQTAYRIRKIGFTGSAQNTTHELKWNITTSANPVFNAAYKFDGTTFSEPEFPDTILDATGDHFYLGFDLPVNSFKINVQSASSGLTRVVEYWDGAQWTAVSNLSDGTNSFGTTGENTISFETPRGESARWKKRTLNGTGPFYWVRFRATAVTTAPTVSSVTRNRSGKLYLSNVYCVIGQIHNQVPSMHVQQRWSDGRLEISGSSLPSTGSWKKGDLVWKTDPSIVSGNPNYHLMGWRRITDGDEHTLGTDWLEMRVPGNLNSVVSVNLDEGFYPIYPALGSFFEINVTADGTVTADSGVNGQKIILRFTQDGNDHAITWDSTIRFGSDIPSADLSTADNKCDYVTCIYNTAGNKWDVVDVVRGFSV